jgi:hypothetical protein
MKWVKVVSTAIALVFVLFVYVAGCESLLQYNFPREISAWASICCVFCIVSGLCAIKCFARNNTSSQRSDDPVASAAVVAGALAGLCLLLVAAQIFRVDRHRAAMPGASYSMSTTLFYFSQLALLVIYIGCVFCLPKGVWKTHTKLSRDEQLKKAVDDMKEKLKLEELELLRSNLPATNSSADHLAAVRDKVFRAIDYAIRRHDWYEDQRSRIFQIILGIAALALTIAGFFLKNLPHFVPLYCSVAGLFLVILIALIAAVFHYNKELDADRPYRLISDIRFWFFRYNLPLHSSAGKSSSDIQKNAEAVTDERRRFLKRIADNFDPHTSLREDLEQLFILQVLQLYKTESLTRLRWLLSYSLLVLPFQFGFYFWAILMAGSICSPPPS